MQGGAVERVCSLGRGQQILSEVRRREPLSCARLPIILPGLPCTGCPQRSGRERGESPTGHSHILTLLAPAWPVDWAEPSDTSPPS